MRREPDGPDGQAGSGTPPTGDTRPSIRGVDVDEQGRCAHWRSELDIVALRLPCCRGYWACHDCHRQVADHPAQRWSREEFDALAVRCGACGAELAIAEYLASPEACPRCAASFNPRCKLHHPLYFEVG